MLVFQQTLVPRFLQFHIFANGDEFHFRRDDALAGIVHLADVLARPGLERLALVHEAKRVKLGIFQSTPGKFRGVTSKLFHITTLFDPSRTDRFQPLA
jgi:hypothetical protein